MTLHIFLAVYFHLERPQIQARLVTILTTQNHTSLVFVDKVEELLLDSWHIDKWTVRVVDFLVDLFEVFVSVLNRDVYLTSLEVVDRPI